MKKWFYLSGNTSEFVSSADGEGSRKIRNLLRSGSAFDHYPVYHCLLLFFRGIRKRLLHLQEAMERRDMDSLPIGIDVQKNDEIGQLEKTFNEMVGELKESKRREQEEEQLRRELIANLSHDLRTPLTKINAHTYSIGKEDLSPEGKQAVKALETSIVNIDRLIENLMSYTLLMASKHKQELTELDAVRFFVKIWRPGILSLRRKALK